MNYSIFHHPTTKIVSYSQYRTFQGYYSAYSGSTDISNDELFRKLILYVTDWLNERLKDNSGEPELSFLSDFPASSEFRSFSIPVEDGIYNRESKEKTYLRMLYIEESFEFSFRIEEPDNKSDSGKYPGRIFITNISIKKYEDRCEIAICMSCKEPKDNPSLARAFRPAFFFKMYSDPAVKIYEGGLEPHFCIEEKPLMINSKSGDECRTLYEKLIMSEQRQLPVLICPSNIMEKKDEEGNPYISWLADKLAGYAYVIADSSGKEPPFMKLWTCFSGEYQDKVRNIYSEGNYLYLLPFLSGDEEKIKGFQDIFRDEQLIDDLLSYPMRRDGIERKPQYSFGELRHVHALWDDYVDLVIEASDREKLERLEETIVELRRQSTEAGTETVNELEKSINDLKDSLRKEREKNINNSAEITKKNEELKALKKKITGFESERTKLEADKDEVKAARESRKMNNQLDMAPLLEMPPLSDISDMKAPTAEARKAFVQWIRDHCGEAVLITDNGEKALLDYSKPFDMSELYYAVYYIYGWTLAVNAGANPNTDAANTKAKIYDVRDWGMQVGIALSGATKKMHKDDYLIDISEFDKETPEAYLDYHYRRGVDDSQGMVRIYLYYDHKLKKSIIGSLPGHLQTASYR